MPKHNLFLILTLLIPPKAFAQNCTEDWEIFSSKPYLEKAFPDTNVTYWRYRFELSSSTTGIRIHGKFPYSRYMNFNVYDQKTLDTVGSLPDRDILPDPGSLNPFIDGVERDTASRSYTVQIVPSHSEPQTSLNTLFLPENKFVEIWYRVYAPDQEKDENGGVALPTLESFDVDTGEPTACPKRKALSSTIFLAIGALPPGVNENRIEFYRPTPSGMYANKDNQYLAGFLENSQDWVSIVRFRVPTYSQTDSGGGTFNDRNETRYWSLCVGGVSQKTSDCLRDARFKVGKDGFVTAVVGPAHLRSFAEAHGLNYLDIGDFQFPLLIYRNLLGEESFPGYLGKVPFVPGPSLIDFSDRRQYAAHRFIGEYAPKGMACPVKKFLSDLKKQKQTACEIPF